ncbi:MAG: amidase, partial [Verrucomicrobia bacterium]|nr:amidase [Verrucomicrobiota bacterium]
MRTVRARGTTAKNRIRFARKVSDAVLQRIEKVNSLVNAIVTLDVEGARAGAKASEARWQRSEPLGPFDGVPITVKDNLLVKGLRATWGSKLYADFVPS